MSRPTPTPPGDQLRIADVLHRTRDTLRTAEFALEGLERAPDGEHRIAAMRNVVVFGRSVTFVLQNLSSAAPSFAQWYAPWQAEMARNPLLLYMKDLRNEIEKQGKARTVVSTYIRSFRYPDDVPPPPPNAKGFFIGDQFGGSGWQVQLEDGTLEKMYVTFPEGQTRTRLIFANLPLEYQGAPISGASLETVCRLYMQYLRRLVNAAVQEFGNAT